MIRSSPVRSRLLLGLIALLPLAIAPMAQAQTSVSCTTNYLSPCVLPGGGGIIFGGTNAQPSTITTNPANGNFGGDAELNIFGGGDSITDLNTQPGYQLGQTQIFGAYNTFSGALTQNTVVGYANTISGQAGGIGIYGNSNTVTSNDAHIQIVGDNNDVSGTQGQNYGLNITGGGNTVVASSGVVNGTLNTLTNSFNSTITGTNNALTGNSSSVLGNNNVLTGNDGAIVGSGSSSEVLEGGSVVGSNSHLGANATGSIILGSNTSTDTPNQAAFGGRTLGQLGNGVLPDDGVAVNQLFGFASALGGGASFSGGVFTAPNYLLDQYDFNDVGSALTYLDGRINGITIPPPINPPPPPVTPPPASSNDPNAVHYDAGSNDASVTLQGANGTTITNLAPGEISATSTQAINGSQLYAAEQTAKTYTDTQVQAGENWAKAYTDAQIKKLNQRFDTTQAMATAQTQMVATFAGQDPANHNRVAAGVGFAGGHNGLAVGYQHTSPTGRFAWNIGAAAAGRDRTIGVGFGTSW